MNRSIIASSIRFVIHHKNIAGGLLLFAALQALLMFLFNMLYAQFWGIGAQQFLSTINLTSFNSPTIEGAAWTSTRIVLYHFVVSMFLACFNLAMVYYVLRALRNEEVTVPVAIEKGFKYALRAWSIILFMQVLRLIGQYIASPSLVYGMGGSRSLWALYWIVVIFFFIITSFVQQTVVDGTRHVGTAVQKSWEYIHRTWITLLLVSIIFAIFAVIPILFLEGISLYYPPFGPAATWISLVYNAVINVFCFVMYNKIYLYAKSEVEKG